MPESADGYPRFAVRLARVCDRNWIFRSWCFAAVPDGDFWRNEVPLALIDETIATGGRSDARARHRREHGGYGRGAGGARAARFAAIAPICGRVGGIWCGDLSRCPSGYFTGKRDPVVPLAESQVMATVEGRRQRAETRFTERSSGDKSFGRGRIGTHGAVRLVTTTSHVRCLRRRKRWDLLVFFGDNARLMEPHFYPDRHPFVSAFCLYLNIAPIARATVAAFRHYLHRAGCVFDEPFVPTRRW